MIANRTSRAPRGALLLSLSLAGGLASCRPAVSVESPSPFDEDDPAAAPDPEAAAEPAAGDDEPRPWRGLRRDTVDRARLDAVLDQGEGAFLRGVEVAARLADDGGFIGWAIVQFMPGETRFDPYDLRPGDVLLTVNGIRIQQPHHLHELWTALRTADAVVARVDRGGEIFEIRIDVVSPAPGRGIVAP